MDNMENRQIDLRHISARDFGALGVQDVAYVRPASVNGEAGFAICAADGTPVGFAPERELAFAAVRQHGLEPLSVH